VKKSAQLSSDFTNGMVNSRRETLARIQSVETLIHGFGLFGHGSLGEEANSTFIITENRGRWLGTANVF
jgi:hypothetical protein